MAEMINEERADSIEGRLENEDMLIEKASLRPWFGWGGWGGWRVYDPKTGEDITVSDGMWVIALGEKGMVGLVSVTAVVLLPFALFLRRVPARYWSTAAGGAPAALALLLMLYSIDNLFNAMLNPIYLLAAGGLSGFYVAAPQLLRQRAGVRHAQHPQIPRPKGWRPATA
jgi:O-antigen ligase